MPEQLTKHPDITLKVLRGAGAACGEGAPQHILTKCPAERFCSLPTGELCIYGLEELGQMTQVSPQELAAVVCPEAPQGAGLLPGISGPGLLVVGWVFLGGVVLGRLWPASRRRVG